MNPQHNEKILILWTTDNLETSRQMLLLYAENCPKFEWFEKVTILIWGAFQRLVANTPELQQKINSMMGQGIQFYACKHCAEELGVQETLESCQVEVMYTGEFLSNWIKSGKPFLSI